MAYHKPQLKLEVESERIPQDMVSGFEADAGPSYYEHSGKSHQSSCEITSSPIVIFNSRRSSIEVEASATPGPQQDDSTSDGDIIRLQMLAMEKLQGRNEELEETIKKLEEMVEDMIKELEDMNKELFNWRRGFTRQLNRHLQTPNEVARRCGQELKAHGDTDLTDKEVACL